MSFKKFARALSETRIEFEHLKVAQLAQAILESGRGSSDLFKDHNNPFGMKYRPEMSGFATSVQYTDHAGETDAYCHFADYETAVLGYWRFIDRNPYTGWRHSSETPVEYIRFIAFAGYVGGPHANVPPERREEDRKRKNEYVRTVQRLFSEAEELLESVLDDAPTPAADQIWKRKGVYLDVGHGKKPGIYDPGAVHSGSDITEHALNLVTAAACEAALNASGIPVLVDDGRKSNYQAGLASSGYDVFVSVHHNSVGGGASAQGAEAFSHATKGIAADRVLAAMVSKAIADELNIRDRGRKEAGHSVTSGARDAGVRAAILAEMYFIHQQNPDDPPPAQFDDWSRRGGEAMAAAIIEWLRDTA